ncbi:MAG: Spy/CpxP family protein refolding chaperone [Pyrinomonadaceae bacterium]
MKNHIKIFMPFVIAVVIGSLTFTFSQTMRGNFAPPRMDGKGDFLPPPRGLNPRLLDQLNLTDAQKEQIGKLHDKAKADSQTYFDKLKFADEQLKTMMDGGSFDETQARQIVSQKASAMIELEIIRLRTDAAILNLLTAEQKTQLETLKNQRPQFSPRGNFRPEERPQN